MIKKLKECQKKQKSLFSVPVFVPFFYGFFMDVMEIETDKNLKEKLERIRKERIEKT